MKRLLLVLSAAFLAYAAIEEAYGASLSVPLPDGCVPTVNGYTVACAAVPPVGPPNPPVTPPPGPISGTSCGALGFNSVVVDMSWPPTPLVPNTSFAPTTALLVRFHTPGSGTALFQPTAYPPNQGVSRLYTVSTDPCAFATTNAAVGNIAYGTVGNEPQVKLIIGTCPYAANVCPAFGAYVKPNTTYYITMVNRRGFYQTPGFVNSCSAADCSLRLEFYSE